MGFSPETYAIIAGKGGKANGFATLNENGKVPASQIPSVAAPITSDTETTLTGVLTGSGSYVGSKAIDTSSLTNDNDHIPTSGAVKGAVNQLGVVDAPSDTTSLISLYLNVPLGAIRTFLFNSAAITNLTDYPSSFSSTKFCAFVTIMRALSNLVFYRLDAVSSSGIPKSAIGYPLGGVINWVDL